MKNFILFLLCFWVNYSYSQAPVQMSAQSRYTYYEDFADINNWTFGTAGIFASGIGSAPWKGLAVSGTGTIPNGTRITTATTAYAPGDNNGGLHRINESLVLLSTGTADNTSAVAMDLYLNFTGLNAGLLSYDWASINNSTGNRKASLKVYASIDNVTFTEITAAQILNFTNNAATSGAIRHLQLPAFLNNASNAVIRFYYHNGTGGTTGSRPKLGIDNLKITAVPASLCAAPQVQPTNLVFGTATPNSILGSFTTASPAADSYLVLATTNSALTQLPLNQKTYSQGDNIDDAIVVSTSGTTFSATNLNASTQYYFYVFSYNAICTGGPQYLLQAPLVGTASTTAGNLPCQAPGTQPTALTFTNITTSTISGGFTAASNTDQYLVLRSASASLSSLPVNAVVYTSGDSIGTSVVVANSAATIFNNTGLQPGTNYYYYLFGFNSEGCNNGPSYLLQNPLTATATTQPLQACVRPITQPSNLTLSANNVFITGTFDAAAGADEYLVVYSANPTLNASPADGTTYAVGAAFGNGVVADNTSATGIRINNLQPGNTYYVFVFALNRFCTGGPLYTLANPLMAQATTSTAAVYNYYFGNLHAHSRYSDGNKDNSTFTPADNFAYAKNSLCMDFLGISEHNHAGAGMNKSNWLPGITQAQAATSPNFLALYGMEWGVISAGGHVMVYGVDKLLGWEANNYDLYVAKSDYLGTPQTTGTTGLFRFLNTWGNNSFALLAHPGSSDYNNLAQINYDATADSAIVGSAVESGPAFSTSTNYNNPATSMAYVAYYRKLLAKGYRIGPSMDHDNHYTTFGRTTYSRLAVIAPTLSQNDFYAAMRARHFYATQDCDTRISFTLNNEIMGSDITGTNAPAITINVADPTNATTVGTIKIFKGVPGSGSDATEVFSQVANNVSFTDVNLPVLSSAYYYTEITMAGARSITAPIWYSRGATLLSAQLLSFTAEKTNTPSVVLSWVVAKEEATDRYEIERSFDGVVFTKIETVKARIAANGTYTILDLNPASGLNYYRLKMIAKDGKSTYSKVVTVNFKDAAAYSFTAYPNPVGNILKLDIVSPATEPAIIILRDMFGRVMMTKSITLTKGNHIVPVEVTSLPKGAFFITLQLRDQRFSRKVVKQ